jgi:hypothetical protein
MYFDPILGALINNNNNNIIIISYLASTGIDYF